MTQRIYDGKWALVTGASAGLGTAFARQLAERGANLVLTARREDRLQALAQELAPTGASIVCLPGDLAEGETPRRLSEGMAARDISPDILINNAGFGLTGLYTDRSWEEQCHYIQLMVTACCHLAHLVMPAMRERGWGRIINVSSVAGLVPPSAGHTLYGASKAFLVSFTQSLDAEGEDIRASALCPGFTYTEFHDVNGTRDRLKSAMPEFMMLDADKVVADGLAAVESGKTVCVPGWQYKAIVALSRMMPMGWAEAFAGKQQARYRKT